MRFAAFLRLAVLGLALALGGCASRAPELKPEGRVVATLDPTKKSANVEAKAYNEIVLTLPNPKEPGYRWDISFQDARFLKQTTEVLPAGDGREGPTITFVARAPGRTRLRFVLVPDTRARAVNPVDVYDIVVDIE
jgi:hypothetical protein